MTQRVSDRFHGRTHDCLDTAWTDLLLDLDLRPVPLPNIAVDRAAIAYLDQAGLEGLVLTGGNDIGGLGEVKGSQASPRRDAFEKTAIAWARSRRSPVFAVCRGLQLLNLTLGGSLSPVEGHAGTHHALSRSGGDLPPPFDGLPERFEVNSFHNYAIAGGNLAPGLKSAAVDNHGNVEAAFHPRDRLCGIMWHPERPNARTGFGRGLIRSFFIE